MSIELDTKVRALEKVFAEFKKTVEQEHAEIFRRLTELEQGAPRKPGPKPKDVANG